MKLSRRLFVGSGLLGSATLAGLVGATGNARAAASFGGVCGPVEFSEESAAFLQSVLDSVSSIQESNPEAQGLNELRKLSEAIYPAEPGSEDDRLLQGALYLKAQDLAEMYARPPSTEELAERLSKPFESKIHPEYFHQLLAKTKERIASNPEYGQVIEQGSEQAARFRATCNGGNDWWPCIIAIVIIIIILL